MRPLFKFFYSPKIIGAEKIPSDSAVVIAGNHKHVYDQCLTIMATKRVIHYMAKKEYFDGKFAFFFRAAGCIPVDRSRRDLSSAMSAMRVLKSGGAIGIFPEGTRNKGNEDEMLPFFGGASMFAIKTKTPIVPFFVCNRPKPFHMTHVRFGEPMELTEYYDRKLTAEDYAEADAKIRARLYELRDEHRAYLAEKKNKKKKRKES
jgi:1-acyl-sn-glycerol-3-phosphate acyltransferase